ncbi:MAG: TIGR00341 family protein [Candidatus Bipolaricaulia bacterium]
MALRLIEVYLPLEQSERLYELVGPDADERTIGIWEEWSSDDQALIRLLADVEETEGLLDTLHQAFSGVDEFRLLLLSVEATLPRPEPPEDEPTNETAETTPESNDDTTANQKTSRINREELYTQLSDQVRPSPTFLVLVALSTLVASVGLVTDNVAVIIGGMVIAPLLGPNMALALATTLGDLELAQRAMRITGRGLSAALGLSILAGLLMPPLLPNVADLSAIGEIQLRSQARFGDIALALASGGAGALSFTLGLSTAVVGVMVSVALLPPLVVFGMFLGAGLWMEAFGALQLLLVNIICVNLAGVTTFLIQGIRPATWWEAQKARRASRRAILVWVVLLLLLIGVMLLGPGV